MGRLFLIAMILLAAGFVIVATLSNAGRAARSTRRQIDLARPGGVLMQKTSFVLLVALVLYVSLWGGA